MSYWMKKSFFIKVNQPLSKLLKVTKSQMSVAIHIIPILNSLTLILHFVLWIFIVPPAAGKTCPWFQCAASTRTPAKVEWLDQSFPPSGTCSYLSYGGVALLVQPRSNCCYTSRKQYVASLLQIQIQAFERGNKIVLVVNEMHKDGDVKKTHWPIMGRRIAIVIIKPTYYITMNCYGYILLLFACGCHLLH